MLRALLACAAASAPLASQACMDQVLWSATPLPTIERPIDSARIDALLRERQEEHGLAMAERADPRTLLRRAALVLTGLPPTAEQVDAFCADPTPTRFAAEVDRLLASPQSAEHLARRWLDLARYSDSNGLDENLAFGNAWRYRDWVIDAFLQDMPYDRFGTLQLAGDVLPDDDPAEPKDRIVPTGFLALGPRMLAEQDKEKLVLDTVDEQVDLVGRTFLGLTLGCARCHDHKFDPVPTRDYYALAGIFKSSRSFQSLDHVSQWLERPIATPAAAAARDAAAQSWEAAKKALAAFDKSQQEQLATRLEQQFEPALLDALALAPRVVAREAESANATNLGADGSHWGADGCVVLHTASAGEQFAEYDFACEGGDYVFLVRLASQESRPLHVWIDGDRAIAEACKETTGGWKPDAQRWIRAGRITLSPGKHRLSLTAKGASIPHIDRWMLTPVSAAANDSDLSPLLRNAAYALADAQHPIGKEIQAATDSAARNQVLATWKDRLLPLVRHKTRPPASGDGAIWHKMLHGFGGILELADKEQALQLAADAAQQRARLQNAVEAARLAIPPEHDRAMCVAEGEPVDLPVHVRGSHLALAQEKTPRGFLTALASALPSPAIEKGSGRLALAAWIFDAKNPLTPRVATNRVWQFAFGEGLVRSESNFGMRGEEPSHRVLLDELAASFVANGWSMRSLLRTIVLSDAWQQKARADEVAATQDPDNRMHWRWSRPRLSAEAIRDTILFTAGTLDLVRGGNLLTVGNRGYVTNDQSGDGARYDATRRSIYLPVIRNAMYDLFTVFDYADPSVHIEQRPESAVSLQALLLMNSPFVLAQRSAFAAAAATAEPDSKARIDWIWRRALQRAPTASERAAAEAWLISAPSDESWPGLCQTLFAASEFVYVD